jgi:two-component system osmolarity sensor histidine kinase EnvZ
MDQPAVSLAYPKPKSGALRIALWHFDRLLERFFPDRLFARALIIVIAPIVLLQLIMGYVFIERHYEEVTRSLSRSYVREVAMLIDHYRKGDRSPAAVEELRRMANQHLLLGLEVRRGEALPKPVPPPWFSSVTSKLDRNVSNRVKLPFWIDTVGEPGLVDLRIEVEPGVIFRFLTPIERAHTPSRHVFLLWMSLASLLLLLIAVLFLRNQINPILRLAEAAHAFGLGREVKNFRPAGAREVQAASNAFLAMKGRIERHVEQRTAMLAGVSHDLRTILTRLTLELAMLPTSPPVEAMREDIAEMRRMLEGYLAFARGDGGEQAEPVDVGELLGAVRTGLARAGKTIEIRSPPGLVTMAKPQSIKRCIENLASNACRFGSRVVIAAANEERATVITVDDNGPGVAPERYEEVFRPFVRLDDARNLDEAGTGLGLAIARDVARSHGGDIQLSRSPLGGLRAAVSIPQ